MKMTIIVSSRVRTQLPGVVLFEGKSGNHRFIAKAPITMTR